MHRIYNLVNGAVWAAIPKWAYIVFTIAVLAAGGFGYGFFYQFQRKLQTEKMSNGSTVTSVCGGKTRNRKICCAEKKSSQSEHNRSRIP